MFDYDEKTAYEQRYHSSTRNSCDSTASRTSRSSHLTTCSELPPPPRYTRYSTCEKPLPPLPVSRRSVRFVLEKPLPPLPNGDNKLRRASSREGEYAWWAQKQFQMSDAEWEAIAKEKSPWRE